MFCLVETFSQKRRSIFVSNRTAVCLALNAVIYSKNGLSCLKQLGSNKWHFIWIRMLLNNDVWSIAYCKKLTACSDVSQSSATEKNCNIMQKFQWKWNSFLLNYYCALGFFLFAVMSELFANKLIELKNIIISLKFKHLNITNVINVRKGVQQGLHNHTD